MLFRGNAVQALVWALAPDDAEVREQAILPIEICVEYQSERIDWRNLRVQLFDWPIATAGAHWEVVCIQDAQPQGRIDAVLIISNGGAVIALEDNYRRGFRFFNNAVDDCQQARIEVGDLVSIGG